MAHRKSLLGGPHRYFHVPFSRAFVTLSRSWGSVKQRRDDKMKRLTQDVFKTCDESGVDAVRVIGWSVRLPPAVLRFPPH